MPPFFSVIIATHNRPGLLERALQSLRAQTFQDLQIVVVTDIADARTTEVAGRNLVGSDLFIQRCGTPGPAQSRNIGIDVSSGRYLLFLDDDDTFSPNFLAELQSHIGDSTSSIFSVDFDIIDEERSVLPAKVLKQTPHSTATATRESVQVLNTIPNNCLAYPRALVAQHRYDTALILFEDWQFLLSVLRGATLTHIPIRGPVIHKSDRSLGDRRGASNDDRLAETILQIYRAYPAQTAAIREVRQNHFRNAGIHLPIEHF